jgi:hypothetical protein
MQDIGSQVTFKRPRNWGYLIKRPSGRQIVKSGVYVYDKCRSGIITNDSKTFGLKDLKLTIVGRRSVAPNRGSVGEYRTD